MTLSIGYTQNTITPALKKPVYLAGFGRNRRAETIHDDLYVRALALSQGNTQIVLMALDLIGLAYTHCLDIKKVVNEILPDVDLLIACTHTHHGPDTVGLWGPDEQTSGVDPVYLLALKERVAATALKAMANLQPAQFRNARVNVLGVVQNARDPHILDEELTCLQFHHAQTGDILATCFIFPCHPEVLWDDNRHITADYIYTMRAKVETITKAPCLAFVGSLGGMMTPLVLNHSFDEAALMGQILASVGLSALVDGEIKDIDLSYSRQDYKLRLENPLFKLAAEAGLLPQVTFDDDLLLTEVSLLKLGDTWLLGVPGELLPKLGLRYKAMMRQAGGLNTAIIGLANDELGYILPAEDFTAPKDYLEPGDCYEESMSMSAQAGPALTTVLQQLLER